MHPRRRPVDRFLALTATAVLVLTVANAGPAAAEGREPARPDTPALSRIAAGQPRVHHVTLVTGDTVRVDVDVDGSVDVEADLAPRADGRSVLVDTLVDGEHLYVLPSDAAELVAAGRLDRRLFDVRRLIDEGYSDRTASTLPVIIGYDGRPADPRSAGARSMARASLRAKADALPASDATRTLESINGAALSVTKKQAAAFWATISPRRATLAAGVHRLWLDGRARVSLDVSVPRIGAPVAWAAGLDGSGVKVAVLDTGVDEKHPDLAGKVVASRSFVPGQPVADGHGHGTHVASTVAGTGAADGGKHRGVAPGADLVIGKVLGDNGSGSDSWIVDGMEWAAAEMGANVVSMSLGSGPSDGTDPMSRAVDSLSAGTGALFVIAAGNDGPRPRTVSAPAAAATALTVAAVDKSGVLAGFSSRGPLPASYALKPEIAAPGVAISAARAGGTGTDAYTSMSGTSMATPHVAGAAAILAQQHPDWTAAQLRAALTGTAEDDPHTVYQTGAGQLDVAAATRARVVPATAKLDFGRLRYPQQGPALTRTVTYRNTGDQPVSLAVAARMTDESGAAAPDGMLAVAPASVLVPANGTADVAVTLDPTRGPEGLYSGQVTATADGISLGTPIGAFKEPRGFELTVRVPEHASATRSARGTLLIRRIDQEAGEWIVLPAASTTSVHLFEGVYSVRTTMAWSGLDGDLNNVAALVDPQVEVTADTDITLDVNRAEQIEIEADRPTEVLGATLNTWHVPAGSTTPFGEVSLQLPYGMRTWALPTRRVTVGTFFFDHHHLLGTPLVSARVPGLGLTLTPRYQHYSASIPKLTGRTDRPLVDAGRGSAEDFARIDARGKVVLIDIGDKSLVPLLGHAFPGAELANAAAAGAVAVLGYGDGGYPVLGTVPMRAGTYPLPTMALPGAEGRALRAGLARRPSAILRIDAQPAIPHLYSLAYLDDGAIPAALRYRVRDRDLTTLAQDIHADRPAGHSVQVGVRWPGVLDLDDYSATFSTVTLADGLAPAARTHHLGPVSATTVWSRQFDTFDLERWLREGPNHSARDHLSQFGMQDVFDRPVTRAETWGQAPTVPGMPLRSSAVLEKLPELGAMCAGCRYSLPGGDRLVASPFVLDGDGHNGPLTGYANFSEDPARPGVDEWRLSADGVELPQESLVGIPGLLPSFVLPDRPATYRLTQHFVDNLTQGGYGNRADTTWTFQSRPSTQRELPKGYDPFELCAEKCRVEPLIFLNYRFNLPADNRLAAPGVHVFTVTPYRQPSSAAMSRITGLTVSASHDGGRTWRRLPAIRTPGGSYLVLGVHPAWPGAAGTVSLRTEAWDAAGNRVVQTVPDAYGLVGRR